MFTKSSYIFCKSKFQFGRNGRKKNHPACGPGEQGDEKKFQGFQVGRERKRGGRKKFPADRPGKKYAVDEPKNKK